MPKGGTKEAIAGQARRYRERYKDRLNAKRREKYQQNKEKELQRNRDWRRSNPELYKAQKLRERLARLGMTPFDVDVMLLTQLDCCAICGAMERLFLDHNHATGRARAMLCNSCNSGLGLFKENVEALANAIEYLKQHS